MPRYLTAAEVAKERRKTEGALSKERKRGQGPPWIQDNGRILYPEDELERYLAERTTTSTSAA